MAKDQTNDEGMARTQGDDALFALRAGAAPHIAAIQALARQALQDAPADDAGRGTREVRLEIVVGPKEATAEADAATECYDEDYICGKSETGYIHCTAHVCMTVGPITVAP